MPTALPLPARVAFTAALSLALAACVSSESRAQKVADKVQQRFAAADLNHDGYLSRDEANQGMPRLAAHFDEIDSNHDGRLSGDEIRAYLRQRFGSR